MKDENEKAVADDGTDMVPVFMRFSRAELDAMRRMTGATKDATAVGCVCRLALAGAEREAK